MRRSAATLVEYKATIAVGTYAIVVTEPSTSRRPRLWVVSELFYPEEVSTGHFVTGIAEGLSGTFDVRVLCSQPSYAMRGALAPSDEIRNGIRIHRVQPPLFDKNVLPLRILTSLLVTTSLAVALARRVAPRDHVLVVTNPPMLPYVVALVCRIRGAAYTVLVHDVYPDVLIAVGFVARGGVVDRILSRAVRWLYDGAEQVVGLGRDMARNISGRMSAPTKVHVIPNWGDDEQIIPTHPNSGDRFVVQYLGNMGRTHDIETLVGAARLTRDDDIVWTFVGDGAKRSVVERELATGSAGNIALCDRVSAEQLSNTLASADISVVAFVTGMSGISVPSRVYNVMCAARPLLLVADADSEVAELVREYGIGWVVPPGDPVGLAETVRRLASDRAAIASAGAAARALAEAAFTRRAVIDRFRGMFRATLDAQTA